MRCQCVAGSISCVPRCPMDVHPPILGCPSPSKVQVPGECCMQWECPQIRKLNPVFTCDDLYHFQYSWNLSNQGEIIEKYHSTTKCRLQYVTYNS